MDTQETSQRAGKPPKNHNFFRYAWDFIWNGLRKDNYFWSRWGGVTNGALIVAQGVAGIHPSALPLLSNSPLLVNAAAMLSRAPLLLHAAAIAGCAALAGIGICAICYGLPSVWKSLENRCERSFPKFNLLKRIRISLQAIAKGIASIPPVRKLGNGIRRIAKNVAQKPLAQKFFKTRLGRASRGLTDRQRDVFLASLAIEGSLASLAFYSIGAAAFIGAAPHLAAGALAVVGLVAAYEAVTNTWSFYNGAKTLIKSYRARKNEKKFPAPAIAPRSPQSANDSPAFANAAPVFNGKAGREKPEKSATPTPAAQSAGPVRSTYTP